jgi:hypothetical protein
VFECQQKHWKIKQEKNKSFVSGNIPGVSSVEGPEPYTGNLKFVEFVLESWQTKGKYPE